MEEEQDAPFELQEVELEDPDSGEARVRIAASGVCHTDEITRGGDMPKPFPSVLGHGGSGMVEEVGEGPTPSPVTARAWGSGFRAPVPALALLFILAGCGGGDPNTVTGPEVEPPEPTQPALVWPLSRSEAADADSVHAPYGPRALPSRYDFHAGIDLPAPRGTRANAVLPGRVVEVRHWNGTSSGAGNAVLLAHDGGVHTNYLHLDEIQVVVGQQLRAGERVGTVGSTGATYPHLHLGYFVGLPGTSGDERLTRNPLELLPTGGIESAGSVFQGDTVHLDLPLRGMTVRKVILEGSAPHAPQGEGRLELDYYAVVARGATSRHEQAQFGVHVDAGRPAQGRFDLIVHPLDPEFRVERVRLVGIGGDTLHVAERPGGPSVREDRPPHRIRGPRARAPMRGSDPPG